MIFIEVILSLLTYTLKMEDSLFKILVLLLYLSSAKNKKISRVRNIIPWKNALNGYI